MQFVCDSCESMHMTTIQSLKLIGKELTADYSKEVLPLNCSPDLGIRSAIPHLAWKYPAKGRLPSRKVWKRTHTVSQGIKISSSREVIIRQSLKEYFTLTHTRHESIQWKRGYHAKFERVFTLSHTRHTGIQHKGGGEWGGGGLTIMQCLKSAWHSLSRKPLSSVYHPRPRCITDDMWINHFLCVWNKRQEYKCYCQGASSPAP